MPGTAQPSERAFELRLVLGIVALLAGLIVTFAGLRTPERPLPAWRDLDKRPAVSVRVEPLVYGAGGQQRESGRWSWCACETTPLVTPAGASMSGALRANERFADEGAGVRDMVRMYSSPRAFLDMYSQLQHKRPRSSIAEIWEHRYGVAYTTGRGSPLEAQAKREEVEGGGSAKRAG